MAQPTRIHHSPELSTLALASSPSDASSGFSDMVEIKQDSPAMMTSDGETHRDRDPHEHFEDNKHRLLYSLRSYIHPTAYSRDNIPGFVAIVKRESISPTYLLSWIPESLLDGRADFNKFIKAQKGPRPQDADVEDDDMVLVDVPSPQGEYYAFSVAVTSIYSLTATPPTFSSWHGSISLNLINGSTLPTIYFHDDESRSFQAEQRASPNAPSWGGELLLQRLRSYAHLLRSSLMPNLFLIDPSRVDIEAHSTPVFDDAAVDDIFMKSSGSFGHQSSPIPPMRRPGAAREMENTTRYPPSAPVNVAGPSSSGGALSSSAKRTSLLHQTLPSSHSSRPSSSNSPRNALLSSFAQLTQATRTAAQNILSHPLAKPIVPHLPDPVRTFVHAPGEWESWVNKGGMGEFESARIYLAKWARVVAEEGERARQNEAFAIPHGPGEGKGVEKSDLGVFELIAANVNLPTPKPTRDPHRPVDNATWDTWFNPATGEPTISFEQFRGEVFRRGFHPATRRKAWPYLLGVLPWNANNETRERVLKEKQSVSC
ncbi:hypothetical protein DL93DRAFT_2072269 [Clavulina sp. PMI_390]|nr:hypothetical protein DL93DRAFT_2072269 [Clavulina sp. PMI_390]